jgi:AcrR family transcriptional regulator
MPRKKVKEDQKALPSAPLTNTPEVPQWMPSVPPPPEWQVPQGDSPPARIVAAARELFAKQGFEATSIRDITEAANVNSAMVHYYFRNKEELYHRVLGHEILTVFRAIHEQIEPGTSPGELLVTLPTRVMRVVRANPVWAKLLSREISGGALHLQRVVADLKDAGPLGVRTKAEALYKEAVRRGELRDLPVLYVIQFLLVLGYSGVFFNPFFRVIGGHDPDEERFFNERLRTFDTLIRHALIPEKKPSPKL